MHEFSVHFDWPDAVIEVSPDSGSIADEIGQLDANPHRTELLRRTNAVRCLEMHDWAHRWEHILATIGMEPPPQLQARKAQLRRIAANAMALA